VRDAVPKPIVKHIALALGHKQAEQRSPRGFDSVGSVRPATDGIGSSTVAARYATETKEKIRS